MTFENTKRKISKIENQSIEDEVRISRQEDTNDKININVRSIIPSLNAFKIVRNLDFDWEDLDLIDSQSKRQYKIWSIEFSRIDQIFIPYITVEVTIRPKDEATGDIDFLNGYTTIYFFEVEDIPDSDTEKHVIMHIQFRNTTTTETVIEDVPLHEVKLLVDLANPMDFI